MRTKGDNRFHLGLDGFRIDDSSVVDSVDHSVNLDSSIGIQRHFGHWMIKLPKNSHTPIPRPRLMGSGLPQPTLVTAVSSVA